MTTDNLEEFEQLLGVFYSELTLSVINASYFRRRASSGVCDDFVRKPSRESVIFEKMAEHLGVRYVY